MKKINFDYYTCYIVFDFTWKITVIEIDLIEFVSFSFRIKLIISTVKIESFEITRVLSYNLYVSLNSSSSFEQLHSSLNVILVLVLAKSFSMENNFKFPRYRYFPVYLPSSSCHTYTRLVEWYEILRTLWNISSPSLNGTISQRANLLAVLAAQSPVPRR